MSSLKKDFQLTSIVVISTVLIISLIVSAVGKNSVEINGYSAVLCCAIICIGSQWLVWIPASIKQTEKFYDLTGGLTYLTVVIFSLWAGSQSEYPSVREFIISILVIIWSLRLSIFLYLRIHRVGKDGRFDELKNSPVRFLVPWTLQGLWVFLTVIVVIVINSKNGPSPPIGIWDIIGLGVWIFGFIIEVLADNQKSKFNSKPENKGKWIDNGLWAYSRHPNYFGEILLWSGIAIFGFSCLSGLELLTWVSPVFIYLLLTKISGVPLLDKRALEKWGDDPEYQKYRDKTSLLFPIKRNK